jgi:hypothetical protein
MNGRMNPYSRLNDVVVVATIEPHIGHFATKGFEMLHKLQLQHAKMPLGVGIVAENTTLVTRDAQFHVLVAE